MADFASWIQTGCVVIGLGFNALSLRFNADSVRRDAKSREDSNRVVLTQQHQDLWFKILERRELNRILQANLDLTKKPPTLEEEEALNLILMHYELGWSFAREGEVLNSPVLAKDIRGFFTLPIPHVVWEKTKEFRDPEFVRFVERALERGHLSAGT